MLGKVLQKLALALALLVAFFGSPASALKVDAPVNGLKADVRAKAANGKVSSLAVKSSNGKSEFVKGELIVKWRPGVSSMRASSIHKGFGASKLSVNKQAGFERIKISDTASVEATVDSYRNMPEVEYAEPNYIFRASVATPDDTSFGELWGLNNTAQTVNGTKGTSDADMDVPEAWDIQTGSSSVVVAVIDSGVDYNHPDLSANIWSNTDEPTSTTDSDGNGYIDDVRGWDFVDNDNDPMDLEGHGTHIAGTIGAVGDNTRGIVGVTKSVQIMPLRALDETGSGSMTDVANAITYACNNGADIINLSLGGSSGGATLENAINACTTVLFVAAAGNNRSNNDGTPEYPASYSSVMSIASTNQNDEVASFSNYGVTSVDVSAPGVNIYSAQPERYVMFSDNFDDGDISDWTTGGTNDSWGLDDGTSVTASSGGYSLSDSPLGDYVANTDSWARSPAINLSNKEGCRVSFLLNGATELDVDKLYVEASTSIGGSYAILTPGTASGTTSGTWYTTFLNMAGSNLRTSYDGQSAVYIRFRFSSDDDIEGAGFNIDDVTVHCAKGSDSSNVKSTSTDNYKFDNGTSMSTPHVAGLAALLLSETSTLTVAQLKTYITDYGDYTTELASETVSGRRVNAYSSLVALTGADTTAPASPTVTINGGSATASSTAASLDLTATDALGVTGYYASETATTPSASDFTSVPTATSYSATVTFTLSSGNGTKTVYAWFRDASGNISSPASDTIDLAIVAPSSSSSSGGGGGCFIATAAYGSYLHPRVKVLRDFRDDYLLTNAPGRLFVKLYYRYSPPLADFIAEHDSLRGYVRLWLAPAVFAAEYPPAGIISFLAFSLLLFGAIVRDRSRRPVS